MEQDDRIEVWPLSCPICGQGLLQSARELSCPSGHAFDVAREGYINLLPSQHHSRGIDGDLPAMLHARRRFLEAGHYRALLEALESRVAEELAARSAARAVAAPSLACVLEVGCGEGYYLGNIARDLREAGGDRTVFLGADVSKSAARLAAKHYGDSTFVVADVNRRIYVHDGSVAVLLDIFAPRNPVEFARVLEPGGIALIVIPAETHLATLRDRLGLLGIQEDKEARVIERFADDFRLLDRTELRYPIELSAEAERDLVEMGPNHWHRPEGAETGAVATVTEASFVILKISRNPSPTGP